MRVGLISDTHNLLRPQALAALQGCDRLLHAGDIGGPHILDALRALAPVDAVRGNNDTADWAQALPLQRSLDLGGVRVQMLHDLKDWPRWRDPKAQVVVTGHSHRPLVRDHEGVLWVNPGSAGPRRFSLPVSVALLTLNEGRAQARVVLLDVGVAARPRRPRSQG